MQDSTILAAALHRSPSSSARPRSPSPSWWTRATASTSPTPAGGSPRPSRRPPGSYAWLQPAPPPATAAVRRPPRGRRRRFQRQPRTTPRRSDTVRPHQGGKAGVRSSSTPERTPPGLTRRANSLRRRVAQARSRSVKPPRPERVREVHRPQPHHPGTIEIEKEANPEGWHALRLRRHPRSGPSRSWTTGRARVADLRRPRAGDLYGPRDRPAELVADGRHLQPAGAGGIAGPLVTITLGAGRLGRLHLPRHADRPAGAAGAAGVTAPVDLRRSPFRRSRRVVPIAPAGRLPTQLEGGRKTAPGRRAGRRQIRVLGSP